MIHMQYLPDLAAFYIMKDQYERFLLAFNSY